MLEKVREANAKEKHIFETDYNISMMEKFATRVAVIILFRIG